MEKEIYKKILQELIDKCDGVTDISWQEIIDKYALGIHKDSLRKAFSVTEFSGYNIYKHLIEDMSNDNKDVDLEAIKEDIIKERRKLQATKVEYNRNKTHDSRFELFYENVRDAFETLPVPEFEYVSGGTSEREHILTFSDIHYGANFKSENNSYSIDECHRRFERMLGKTIEYVKRDNIRKLKVLNCGDSVQGILRMSDLKLNETSVVDAIVGVSKLIASFLNELSAYCEVEYIHVGAANHTQTRPLGTKASELANEDVEKVIINYIHDVLQNNNMVKVHMTDGSDRVFFDILGFQCCGLHGHQIKNVKNAVKDLSMLHRRFFDYVFIGHLHAGMSMVVGESDVNSEVIVVTGMVGSDPYSDSLMCGSKAMAQIHTFDKYDGRVEIKNLLLN